LPGRTLVWGKNTENVLAFEIYDSDGNRIAAKTMPSADDPFRSAINAFSNRRDQFLLLSNNGVRNDGIGQMFAGRLPAEGVALDPQSVRIGGEGCISRAVALRNHWLLFRCSEAIEFPEQESHRLPEGECVRDAAPTGDGRATLLMQKSETVEGVSV